MNKIAWLILTCITFSALGQPRTKNKNITTTRTDQHINIPGTRVYIIPPPDYKLATAFPGFQKGETAMIQVYDLVGGNYYTNAHTFSKAAFENRGVNVFEYREFKINEYPAKYVLMQSEAGMKAINLVFGDTTFSTLVMALYPFNNTEVEREVQHAIRTIYYDKNLTLDLFANASFTLDESQSIFKFSTSASGVYIYTIAGANKPSAANEPLVIVSTLPNQPNTTTESIAEILIAGLEQNGLTDRQLKNKTTLSVNGLQAYEAVVYGNMQGQPCFIYQLIVNDSDKAIAIQGIVKADVENNLKEIKKLTRTLKLK